MSLPVRKIGSTVVSAIGYGAMGIAGYYGPTPSDAERFKVLDAAHANGCTFWDTSDAYVDSEVLIGDWFKRSGKRNEIFVATKFGFTLDANRPVNGSPEYVKQACESSLKRLGVSCIDLYYVHRADPTVPIEKTVGAIAELVKAGKVKYIGLSECSSVALRRAHAVHPISALQVEYSPFTLDIEHEKIALLKTARELGVTIVAYSPMGRGLLTGQYKSLDDFAPDDFRRTIPKFSNENFPNILKLANGLKEIGAKHNATAGQVSLAWVLGQGNDVIPIPGTTKIKNLEENAAAAKIQLSPGELAQVRSEAARANALQGNRYGPGMFELLYLDTPELN